MVETWTGVADVVWPEALILVSNSPEFGLETPTPLAPHPNYLRLEGWGFVPGGSKPPKARIRIGDTTYEPENTSRRLDVAERFPDESQATECGFLFVILLPTGVHQGVLEFSGDGGNSWVAARDLAIPVSPHPLMGEFEPAGTDGVITSPVRLAGWCWHPELEIADMILLVGDMEVPVLRQQERPDVAERFPDQPAARFAGFITEENLPRGRGKIRLQVTSTCGRIYFLDPGYRADIDDGAFAPPRSSPEMWELSLPTNTGSSGGIGDQTKISAGEANVLFVLHGDFTANSAYHVTALANELIARGYDCVVAVPRDGQTIGAQPQARFLSLEFSELASLPRLFRDGLGPRVTHLWTPREHLREFWEQIHHGFETTLLIHLEDNEGVLLADHLNLPTGEIDRLQPEKIDSLVPPELSHPVRSKQLMEKSAGVTAIYDSLTGLIPVKVPHQVFWPAATDDFGPRAPNTALRQSLGISDEATTLFYHGNTHATNLQEVGELYRAVHELNQRGRETVLIRTGRDIPAFAAEFEPLLGTNLIHLGFIKRSRDLPELMSMADFFVQPGTPGAFNDYRFPSKLPEFFAFGRPVILPASNLGNVVKHREDAFVVPEADAPSIANAIEEIRADQKLYAKLSAGAVAFAQTHFSWSRSAKKLIEFYQEVAGLRAPGQRALAAAEIINQSFDKQ